jgi:hypothetical protein
LTVKPQIPPLLMTPLPLTMGVRIPKSFAEYVQKEHAHEREWEIHIGAGQAEAIRRVTGALFEHTLVLGDQSAGDAAAIAEHRLNAILETTLDSYVYLLPSPGASDYYSATIGYKVNLLAVDGTLLGSWIYEGYGSAPSRGLGDAKGVELVTGLAIRDACANLAVHLPDQELVRNLLTPAASTPTTAPATASGPTPAPAAGASVEAKSPIETKPSAESAPSATTTPSAGTVPSADTLPADAKSATDAKPTPETPPVSAPSVTPAPSAAPEAKPPSDGAEAPPARGK